MPEQCPEQLPLLGQPMHFLPLFLDFQMNQTERPRIRATMAIIM